MALPQPTALQMTFAGGIDESTRPELVEPGASWRVLENVRQDQRGGASKRNGFSAQTRTRFDSSTRTSGRRLFPYRDQTCVIDGTQLDAYSSSGVINVTKGRVAETRLTRMPLPYPGSTPLIYDVAYASGYIVALYESFDAVLIATVTDAATGAVVRYDVVDSAVTLSHIKLVVVENSSSGRVVVAVYSDAANNLHARTLVVANVAGVQAGWSGATAIATDFSGTVLAAMDAHGLEDRFAVAYANNSGGTNRLTVKTYNAATRATLETLTINTASNNPTATTLAGTNADTLWIGWGQGTQAHVMGVRGNALATTLATSAAVCLELVTIHSMGIVVTGAAAGRLVISPLTAPAYMAARSFTTSAGAVTPTGSQGIWHHVALLTRPWLVDGRVYCTVTPRDVSTEANEDRCHFVVDVTDATTTLRVVANIAARQSPISNLTSLGSSSGMLVHYAAISSTKLGVVNLIQRSFIDLNTGVGTELAIVDYAHIERWQTVEHSDVAVMTGGVTNFFDGHRIDECNFLIRPGTVTATVDAAGSGITGTNLRYCVIWEKDDHAGHVHWSAPSDPTTAVSPANDAVDLVIPCLSLTTHHDASSVSNPARAVIYRSGDNGAGPYRRVGTVTNNPGASTLSFEDTMPAGTAATQQQLYCVGPGGPSFEPGAEQVHQCPPSMRLLAVLNDMLVGVADDGRTLWYSAQPIVGEGAWFNDVFQLPILEGGEITTLAAQDGTIYIFKRRSIFAVAGSAPSGNGAQGGLGEPRKLAVDVGASQLPTCVTALGILFVSERGIECLTRAQTVEYCGEPVKDTLAAFPIVTSMTFDPDSSCVFVECAASESSGAVTGTGRTLVYDTRTRLWQSTDRRTSASAVADAPAQDGAIVYTGSARRYAWLSTDGYVHVEDRTTWLDPGSTWITMRAESPKLRSAGIQANHKLMSTALLADRATNHRQRVQIAYDDAASWTDDETWTDAELAALSREQLEVDCSREQVMSVAIRLEDSAPTTTAITTGEGATWIGLALNIGANNTRQATTLLPAGHRK